ncbi:hypothetical protein V8E54_005451 [Elaphomyces granulatus]
MASDREIRGQQHRKLYDNFIYQRNPSGALCDYAMGLLEDDREYQDRWDQYLKKSTAFISVSDSAGRQLVKASYVVTGLYFTILAALLTALLTAQLAIQELFESSSRIRYVMIWHEPLTAYPRSSTPTLLKTKTPAPK